MALMGKEEATYGHSLEKEEEHYKMGASCHPMNLCMFCACSTLMTPSCVKAAMINAYTKKRDAEEVSHAPLHQRVPLLAYRRVVRPCHGP